MAATVYRVRASVEIAQRLRDRTAMLPDHMRVRDIGEPDGQMCVVTFEDHKAPHSLDGKLIDLIFVQHADGRVTVEYGAPVVEAGVPVLVGERRPEVFVPDVAGTIRPTVDEP